mgnify:CR=1 FL=1
MLAIKNCIVLSIEEDFTQATLSHLDHLNAQIYIFFYIHLIFFNTHSIMYIVYNSNAQVIRFNTQFTIFQCTVKSHPINSSV